MKNENITTWSDLKDEVYGKKGTTRRDRLDREFKSFKIDYRFGKQEKKNI